MILASSRIALRPSSGRVPAWAAHPPTTTFNPRDALAPCDDLAAVAGGFGHQHIFGLAALGLDQRARGRAADLLIGDVELGHAKRRTPRAAAKLRKRVVGAALHVIDAGPEGDIALDPERQPIDESERVHGVEMAEHKYPRHILAP